MKNGDLADLVSFIFELGQLKRTPRSGWLKLGVDNPESVADHSFRTAAIGFLLGKLEGENPYEVAGYCLFHDVAETRTMDLDWLAQNYLEKEDSISSDVIAVQIDGLPAELKSGMSELLIRSSQSDRLVSIARDADLLDLIFQALELTYHGKPLARKWFENTVPALKTESGKLIGEYLIEREQENDLEQLVTWWERDGPNRVQDS
ncbi:MAG: HD domain-containing protein [Candidatus Bipolaricaulota bacterium]|nr:HD domain-containing protein [Candidatus Bipolaricaulota bacterium]MBS3791041.1 HD domain-containing protein [Candidatus Bipolaricaulota bacterium]